MAMAAPPLGLLPVLLVFVSLCLVLAAHPGAAVFYLPGAAPSNFGPGSVIEVKVNGINSVHTQLPYSYYELPFCKPHPLRPYAENLGELLVGERIENTIYNFSIEDVACRYVCHKKYSAHELKRFEEKIAQEYRAYWMVDNLPAATKKFQLSQDGKMEDVYEAGFPIGVRGDKLGVSPDQYFLYNHIHMVISYHSDPAYAAETPRRIVGFEIEPYSIKHDTAFLEQLQTNPEAQPSTCGQLSEGDYQSVKAPREGDTTVVYTFSVKWKESAVTWASRWDVYLKMADSQIHWFSIINSMMIVLFLSGMVAMIMMRTLHADFRRYGQQYESPDEAQEESGWKLVHGDVFRTPASPLLLAVLVGTGTQVFSCLLITLIFAMLGFLSPANRGGLMTVALVLYVTMGVFAGYFSARCYKMWKGANWTRLTLTTALFFPSIVFSILFVLELFLLGKHSTGAVGPQTVISLLALWLGVSLPLMFLGSYFGWKKVVDEPPVRTNQIPRQIPEQVWYMKPVASVLMGGILPFGAVFIELFFILSSIWQHQFYYIFGFLFIVFVILVITCTEITIVMCYFQLCSEDYHWWWRSFMTSGASAGYMFLYAIFYFFTKMQTTLLTAAVLYFGYTLIMSFAFFLMTGMIGFYACYFFVRKIYSLIKVD